ncbi:MAG: hypothetical protein II046_04575 [Clostridiales bacterium]|nr:hypothetical protein [Clostridiales bacterium]
MIKRLAKSKKSKKGAILVIVVLILALAMIFIASAMMLTQATRRRLYSTTMQSQARLTVTAASEVFLEALKTQEITDVQIDAILGAHATRTAVETDKARMLVDGVPGMGNTADNCTYIDIYKDDNYATNKKIKVDFTTVIGNERENIQVILQARDISPSYTGRFSNQIELGKSVSKEQLRFTEGVGMIAPAYLSELATANASIVNPDDKLYVDDNTVLIRGSATEQASGGIFYSDVVYYNGSPYLGGNNTYNGRLVMLDSSYFTQYSSSTVYNGDFYFIGKNNSDVGIKMKNANSGTINTKNFIFSNRNVIDSALNDNNDSPDMYKNLLTKNTVKCYIVDSKGSAVDSFTAKYRTQENGKYVNKDFTITNYGDDLSSTSTDTAEQNKRNEINHMIKVYRAYNYENEPFPSNVAEQVFNTINSDGLTIHLDGGTVVNDDYAYGKNGKVYKKGDKIKDGGDDIIQNPLTTKHPDNATKLDLSKLSDLDSTYGATDGTTKTDRIIGLPAGNYYVTGDSPITSSDKITGGPYVICINGSNAGSYRFWFTNGAHKLDCVVFAVYGANNVAPQPAVFILEKGASIQITSDDQFAKTDYICSAGFISIARDGKNTPALIGDYIQKKTSASEDTTWGDAFNGISYSKYYRPKYDNTNHKDVSPKPAIYVFGVQNNTILLGNAAKIEAYMGLYSGGKFESPSNGNEKTQIYGRLEADAMELKTGGKYCMPYCPAPSKVSTLPNVRPAESKYQVCDLIYYY